MAREAVIHIGEPVAHALRNGQGVVALETAVVTHGLPQPHNVDAIRDMQQQVRAAGAEPAVCLAYEGALHVGVTDDVIVRVAGEPATEKASVRDLPRVLATGVAAGLTVSATLHAAVLAGIRVFATGGIGGVHQGASETGDVSADLLQLALCPVITVCSGAKSVLDIPRTLEQLESLGVPVVTYRSYEFPAFYLASSGVSTPCVESAQAVARMANIARDLDLRTGLVVGHRLPDEEAIDERQWEQWLSAAMEEAAVQQVRGKDVTPFLLSRVAEQSGGKTVQANIALLRRNARLAGEIASNL